MLLHSHDRLSLKSGPQAEHLPQSQHSHTLKFKEKDVQGPGSYADFQMQLLGCTVAFLACLGHTVFFGEIRRGFSCPAVQMVNLSSEKHRKNAYTTAMTFLWFFVTVEGSGA